MDLGAKAFVTYKGKTLLILRDDIPTISHPNTWNLPGGGVEEGEDFDTALRRELVEEIGISPKNVARMGKEEFDNGKAVMRYLVRLEESETKELVLGDEGQEMKFFTFDELLSLPFSPHLGNFIHKNKSYLRKIIEDGEEVGQARAESLH